MRLYAYICIFTIHVYISSHSAILEYLIESGQFPDTVAAMQREAGLSGAPAGGEASKGILEKKWTSVVRLQRKVKTPACELNAHITSNEARV